MVAQHYSKSCCQRHTRKHAATRCDTHYIDTRTHGARPDLRVRAAATELRAVDNRRAPATACSHRTAAP